jgi:hypothetical protein
MAIPKNNTVKLMNMASTSKRMAVGKFCANPEWAKSHPNPLSYFGKSHTCQWLAFANVSFFNPDIGNPLGITRDSFEQNNF